MKPLACFFLALAVSCPSSVLAQAADPTTSISGTSTHQPCSTGSADHESDDNTSGARNSASTKDRQDLLDCHFAGLDLAAGPSTGGGFGAQLKGSRQYILTNLNANAVNSGFELPNELVIGYDTNSSWNSKTESRNQISLDLQLGLDGAILSPVVQDPSKPAPSPEHPGEGPAGGEPIAGYGIYADGRYRYGTFGGKSATDHVNQFLAGGGIYFVWQEWMTTKPWVDIWPGVTFTYYTPVSTDTPVLKSALPDGVKADFLQAEFKTGFAFPIAGRNVRLSIAYDASRPTTGTDKSWQSLFDAQLSANLFGSKFEPAVTFQTGKNGGLSYEKQVLIGLITHLDD